MGRLEFTIGLKLIPVLTSVVSWFDQVVLDLEHGTARATFRTDATDVAEGLKDVYTWVTKNKPVIEGLAGAVGLLAAAWGVEKVIEFARPSRV